MTVPSPQNALEEAFIKAAVASLPTEDAEFSRNDAGLLFFCWQSPCPQIRYLWAAANEPEIVLVTGLGHIHVDALTFLGQNIAADGMQAAIIETAIAKAAAILRGDIVFTESLDAKGQRHSTGSCETVDLAADLKNYRRVFGDAMTMRAFNWFGEVKIAD